MCLIHIACIGFLLVAWVEAVLYSITIKISYQKRQNELLSSWIAEKHICWNVEKLICWKANLLKSWFAEKLNCLLICIFRAEFSGWKHFQHFSLLIVSANEQISSYRIDIGIFCFSATNSANRQAEFCSFSALPVWVG